MSCLIGFFMISDQTGFFTEAGTTKAEKTGFIGDAASGIEFISLSLYTPDGKLYTSYGDGTPDISQREIYQYMKETGGLVVDDTSVNGGNLQVAIGTPVTDADGAVTYYLVGNYKYDVLNDVVSNINIGYTGRAFMFNQDGVLMAHSDAEKVRSQENVYTTYSGGDKLQSLFDRALTGEIGASRVRIDGKGQLHDVCPCARHQLVDCNRGSAVGVYGGGKRRASDYIVDYSGNAADIGFAHQRLFRPNCSCAWKCDRPDSAFVARGSYQFDRCSQNE